MEIPAFSAKIVVCLRTLSLGSFRWLRYNTSTINEGGNPYKEIKMEILANDKNKAIEELFGLDEGSLKRETEGHFTATMHGGESKVEISARKHFEEGYIVMTGVEVDGEENELCEWCGTLHPASECKEEIDMGWLCDSCIRGIQSHGEKLTFIE